jgi:hypothetical protein
VKQQVSFRRGFSMRSLSLAFPILAVVAFFVATDRARCADEFQDLVNLIPRSSNAVVLLNMDKAKNSPLGLKEGWKEKFDEAFESGLAMVPPNATRFVLAAQMDFEYKEPLWEAVVMDLAEERSIEQIAEMRGGTPDTIEGLPALARPNDTYIVQLGPKRLAAMGPGNRQAVVRWIRDIRKPKPAPLSPYLEKAATYSDEAGSEIIMALDLEGVMSFERVAGYLKAHADDLKQWQQKEKSSASVAELTKLLSTMQGVRIGVRIGEQPKGMIAVDFGADASSLAPIAKPLLIQVLSDSGALINDFQAWTAKAKKNEVSLAGTFTKTGLRELLSVIESPTSGDAAPKKEATVSPGELPALQLKKSRDYFRNVTSMAADLKDDMKNAKNLASTTMFCEKYAKRINKLPILNVDEELVQYGAFIADQLRLASQSVRTMGIQTNVRSAQVTSSYGGYGYDSGYRYGAYGRYGAAAEMRGVGTERRAIGAQEKAVAATDVQQIRQTIIDATADMRRKMTQKYQVEF